MRTTVIIPTFWTKARGQVKDQLFNMYDHPTPLDSSGTLGRTLESLRAAKGNFDVQVIGAVDDPVYESQLQDHLAELVRPFADIDANVFGPDQLRTLKGRLESSGFGEFAEGLKLEGVGRILNIGLLLAIVYASEAVLFIDDDEVLDDPDYIVRATEFLGEEVDGWKVLGKTGYYRRPDGSTLAPEEGPWWDFFWRKDRAMNQVLRRVQNGPRLQATSMAYGGVMALHKDLFLRVCFDPWMLRGADTDYVINARMHGYEIVSDNAMVVLHDPLPKTRPGLDLRQDIYRFVYEHRKLEYARSQVDLRQVKAGELEPFPGEFLVAGIGAKAALTAVLALLAHLGDVSEWLPAFRAAFGNAGAFARANCAHYFELARIWPTVAERLWDDLPMQTALGKRG